MTHHIRNAERPGFVAIYALLNSNNVIQYVGKSIMPTTRIAAHKREKSWVSSHLILEWTTDENWTDRERHWIKFYRSLFALDNICDGGEGAAGRRLTPEHKDRIRQALMGRRMTDDQKEKLRIAAIAAWRKKIADGWTVPEHWSDLTSRNAKTAWQNPERAKKQRAATLGQKRSPDAKERMRQSHIGQRNTPKQIERWRDANVGKTRSEASKSNMRAAWLRRKSRGWKMSEESRSKISATKRANPTRYWAGKPRSVETRNKISRTLKRRNEEGGMEDKCPTS